MTNKEAIEIINNECYKLNLLDLDYTIKVNTALDLAINALKDLDFQSHNESGVNND